MSHDNQIIRWTIFGRWVATLGIALAIAFGYIAFRPAQAQDRRLPSSPEKRAGGEGIAAGPKSSAEIADLAAKDLAGVEPEQKDTAPVKEPDTASVLRDVKWLSPHMWAFYAIWVVSLIAVAFAVERFLGLRRSKIIPADFAGRAAGFDQPQGRIRSAACPAALPRASLFGRLRGQGDAGQGRPAGAGDRTCDERSLGARGLAAICKRSRTKPHVQCGADAGTGGHDPRYDPLLLYDGPLGPGREQDGPPGDGHLCGADLHVGRAGRRHPGGHSLLLLRGPHPQNVPAGRRPRRSLVPALERFEGRPRVAIIGDKVADKAILEMPHTDALRDESPLPRQAKKFEGRP